MRVAINAAGTGAREDMLLLLNALAAHKQEHELLVFADSAFEDDIASNTNVHVIGPPVTSLLSKRWWLDVKLPSGLKKHHADILLDMNGDACLRTRIPQLLFINDTLFLHHPKELSSAELLFLRFYFPKYLEKAKEIVVPSARVKQDIIKHFGKSTEKITVIPPFIHPAYTEIGWEQKEQVKEEYTGGKEYFLFNGRFEPRHNVINVLKAFSQFKKWQRSNMQLVITGNIDNAEMAEKIRTFKFRDDVIVLHDIDIELTAQLLAAAYAFIHTPLYDASGKAVIEAMSVATPVITVDLPVIGDIAADTVLYVEPGNVEMLAAQMIKLHKDESLRSALTAKARNLAGNYHHRHSAGMLWQLIENTVAVKAGK